MKRISRCLLLAWLVASAVATPAAHAVPQETTPPPPPPSSIEPPAPAPTPAAGSTPTPRDPLEEFVPKEKVKADSAVALPVDI